MTRWSQWAAGALVCLASGCILVADYPDARSEDGAAACSDGVDNNLNGDTDCADVLCAAFCPSLEVVQPAELTPCYAEADFAFREDADTLETSCEPWPEMVPECEGGQVLLPGSAECTELGGPCGDPFPARAGELYVLAGASGGDGSMGAPFGTIAQALAAAQDGDTVVVGAGQYDERVVLDRPVQLVGACAGATRVTGTPEEAPALEVSGSGVTVEAMTVSSAGDGVRVGAGANASFEGVRVEEAGGDAVAVDAGELTARNLAVRGTAGMASAGIRATGGARVEVFGAVLEQGDGPGVVVQESQIELRATAIGSGGRGIAIGTNGRGVLRGVFVQAQTGQGIQVDCGRTDPEDPCLDAQDVTVREQTGSASGIDVGSGFVALTRVLVDGAMLRGLRLDGGQAELMHVTVRDTRRSGTEVGAGVEVGPGSTLDGRFVRLRANLFNGLVVDSGDVFLDDLTVIGEQQSGTPGLGVGAEGPATLLLERFAIRSAGLCGLQLGSEVEFVASDGILTESVRGACVPPEVFTPSALSTRITYAGNGRNIVTDL